MSVIVSAMPKAAEMGMSESIKRKCDDSNCCGQTGGKKRRVQFAESSMCKVILSVTDLSSTDNESDLSSESSQSSSHDESSSPLASSTRKADFVDLTLKNGDLFEQSVPTKLEDGPSRVTQTTNNLILLLVEHGTITSLQVSERLQAMAESTRNRSAAIDGTNISCSRHKEPWSPLPPADSPPASPPTPGSPSSLPLSPCSPAAEPDAGEATAAECPAPSRRGCDDYALCEGVYARLRALSDRIHAHGRAPLLPSTAVMGREFLPALRFLRSAVRDAAALGLRAAAGSSGSDVPSPSPAPGA